MLFKHLVLAVVVSLLLTGVFIYGFRKRGPWNSFLTFFILVALGAWAGGVWFPGTGPSIWGVNWLPFFIVGLLVSLLLVAAMPAIPPDTTVQLVKEGEKAPEAKKRMVLGIYFWLVVIAFAILIVTRYF